MKKAVSVSGCALFALIVLLPLGVILSDCFGYTFELASYSFFAVITALVAVSTTVLCTVFKEPVMTKPVTVLFALAALLSFINTAFYMANCFTVLVTVSMLVCICCCFYLTVRYGKPLALKIISLVLFALMVLPFVYFALIILIFGDIAQNTVVQSVESPNGAYYAEVIDSDQGALGGDTLVEVHETKDIDVLIFRISKKPQRVYWGKWGEFANMIIYWKDDNCLVINSVEYSIKS